MIIIKRYQIILFKWYKIKVSLNEYSITEKTNRLKSRSQNKYSEKEKELHGLKN